MSIVNMMKSDATEAGYRVAAKQATNGVKKVCVRLAAGKQGKGMKKSQVNALASFLDTEIGEALIGIGLGIGLQYTPGLNGMPKVTRLAREFRIGGITTAGNMAMEAVKEYIVPAVMETLKGLPEEEELAAAATPEPAELPVMEEVEEIGAKPGKKSR